MGDRKGQESFPVLGISRYHEDLFSNNSLLFHELHGERHIDRPHKHDFFMILLFEKARGMHKIDFIEHSLGDYQLHLVFPGQVHQWHVEEETVGYQLMVDRSLFEHIVPSFRFPQTFYQKHPVLQLSPEQFTTLRYEFGQIGQSLQCKNICWPLLTSRLQIVSLLVSLVLEGMFKDIQVYNINPILSKFSILVDRYFRESRSVGFYAEKLYISANYLNILCRKYMFISASFLIQDRVLLEAKRLLKVSDRSVKEIAYELGFYDQASFSKFFKSKTGVIPSAFREQN